MPPSPNRQRILREAGFFNRVVAADPAPSLPGAADDPQLHALLDAAGEVRGTSVLDICCGAGRSSVLLAARGAASVLGCDVSPASLQAAERLAAAHGVSRRVHFTLQDIEQPRPEWTGRFDLIVGAYALHHLDLAVSLPLLATYLRPGGRAVFLETSALNPVLRWARRHLAGRYGIAVYGTPDEHPLTRGDLALIGRALGVCRVTAPCYTFFRILDRQILHYRWPHLSRVCSALDGSLRRIYPTGSYHLVLCCAAGDRHPARP